MNCREFETIVSDLAQQRQEGPIFDPVVRERGLKHVESCNRCALRLADERTLNSGLKALADIDRNREAPHTVEAALLAQFRKSSILNPSRDSSGIVTVPSLPLRRWALAAAALVLLALSFLAYRANLKRPEIDNEAKIGIEATPAPSRYADKKILPEKQLHTNQSINPQPHRIPDRTIQHSAKHREGNNRSVRFVIREEMTLYAGDSEITTDFLPLIYSATQPPMESGQLIRVQMPRSALLKFGLPMNIERAGMPVKADLLVGEDGLAQAIRFVR
jgi:hypothetical protein